MSAPTCPRCGEAMTRVIDVPYGWWEWDDAVGKYVPKNAASRVDVSPWVHTGCMQELRAFHPQDIVGAS